MLSISCVESHVLIDDPFYMCFFSFAIIYFCLPVDLLAMCTLEPMLNSLPWLCA